MASQTRSGQYFSSSQAIELIGITARQLQWWDERKIVCPSRQGRNRRYQLQDLAEMAVILELRRKGFSLQRVRKAMRFLQGEFGRRLYQAAIEGSQYHLLSDGRNLFLKTSESQIVDLLKNSSQPLLAVCLSDAVTRVRARVERGNKHAETARKGAAVVRRTLDKQKAS